MKGVKSTTASVKEVVQNVVAKADQKVELNKASGAEKAERKAAEDKAGKHEAKAKMHQKQAEIHREYEQKRAEHAAEKERKKGAIYQKQAEKHSQAGAAIVSDKLDSQRTSDSSSSPSYAPAPAGAQEDDMNFTNAPPAVHDKVPLHGSGVPTHSDLHDDIHDVHTTRMMGASPNTGSYMLFQKYKNVSV